MLQLLHFLSAQCGFVFPRNPNKVAKGVKVNNAKAQSDESRNDNDETAFNTREGHLCHLTISTIQGIPCLILQ